MTGAIPFAKPRGSSDYVVRAPRNTDALGHALRGAFGATPPADFSRLLAQLDRIAVH